MLASFSHSSPGHLRGCAAAWSILGSRKESLERERPVDDLCKKVVCALLMTRLSRQRTEATLCHQSTAKAFTICPPEALSRFSKTSNLKLYNHQRNEMNREEELQIAANEALLCRR